MIERLGLVVSVIGGVVLLAGVVLWITDDDSGDDAASPPMPTSEASVSVPSSSIAPEPDVTTPSASEPTASSAPSPSPSASVAQVEEFFDEYVAAIDRGDVDFLFERLHPIVLDQPSADRCRGFIEREILALDDYRTTGEVTGPAPEDVAGNTVDEFFSVPVAFEFQGQSFESVAAFAPVEGEIRWFAECR